MQITISKYKAKNYMCKSLPPTINQLKYFTHSIRNASCHLNLLLLLFNHIIGSLFDAFPVAILQIRCNLLPLIGSHLVVHGSEDDKVFSGGEAAGSCTRFFGFRVGSLFFLCWLLMTRGKKFEGSSIEKYVTS